MSETIKGVMSVPFTQSFNLLKLRGRLNCHFMDFTTETGLFVYLA